MIGIHKARIFRVGLLTACVAGAAEGRVMPLLLTPPTE
jgi:hypothetical protein